jgi:putative MATE family efflux protein
MKSQSDRSAQPLPPLSGRDRTVGSIPRHLIIFSLPMLVGNFLQMLYQFVNLFWVGHYLGTAAAAALGVTMYALFVLQALCIGLTMATTIQVSQHYGAKDFEAVRRVVGTSGILIVAVSLALLVVGEAIAPQILRAMNTPDNVLLVAIPYMRISLITAPLLFGMAQVRSAMQGTGDSWTPLWFQIPSIVLTAILDPVLMFGHWGKRDLHLPAFGLNGTAYATIIAQGLALWALVVYLRRRRNLVAPSFRLRDFDGPAAWKTLQIGLPVALQSGLVSISMAFVMGIVNSFGEIAIAAFFSASRVDLLAFMPAFSFNGAVSALAGQNLGANRPDRVRKIFWWGCLLSGGITVVASALAVCLPEPLLRIFSDKPPVISLGVSYLRIVGACYIFFAVMFVSNGIISGSGRTFVPMIITLVSLWVVRVPLAAFLSKWMGSIDGVWYAISISFAVSMVLSLGYYFSGQWKRGTVRPRTMPPTPEEMFGEEVGEA